MEVYTKFRIGPFAGPPTTTGFASLEMVDPDLDAGKHVQTIIDEYAKLHPDADPAGRNALLARQLLDPKEAVCQIMMLPTGANFANSHTPDQFLPSKEAGMWCTLGACSTRSLSRGSTHIASPDPRTSPVIDPAYFSHPLDVDMAARSVLHVLSLAEVEPLKSILRRDENGSPVPTKDSGGSLPKTLEEAKAFVARNSSSEYHGNGSCAMLPREKGGVVDDQLKVYGTSNIRVVDASIFPLIVQGNIVSMVYAVAEKAADLIKRQVSVDN
jgi:choline dehydrogenase